MSVVLIRSAIVDGRLVWDFFPQDAQATRELHRVVGCCESVAGNGWRLSGPAAVRVARRLRDHDVVITDKLDDQSVSAAVGIDAMALATSAR